MLANSCFVMNFLWFEPNNVQVLRSASNLVNWMNDCTDVSDDQVGRALPTVPLRIASALNSTSALRMNEGWRSRPVPSQSTSGSCSLNLVLCVHTITFSHRLENRLAEVISDSSNDRNYRVVWLRMEILPTHVVMETRFTLEQRQQSSRDPPVWQRAVRGCCGRC
jgi:hypothetical protein